MRVQFGTFWLTNNGVESPRLVTLAANVSLQEAQNQQIEYVLRGESAVHKDRGGGEQVLTFSVYRLFNLPDDSLNWAMAHRDFIGSGYRDTARIELDIYHATLGTVLNTWTMTNALLTPPSFEEMGATLRINYTVRGPIASGDYQPVP